MRFLLMLVVFIVAGFFAFQQLKPKPPPPPPPPPPPAINLEPTPVIDQAEQAKIIRSTNDQDSQVRWEAMVFLDKMKSPYASQILFEKMHKDPDPDVRTKIIRLIGTRHGPEISRHLVYSLKDMEASVRVTALQALDQVGDYATASSITETLKDQDETVRLQALKTLNSLQDKKAAEVEAERRRQEELRRQAEEAARQQQKKSSLF